MKQKTVNNLRSLCEAAIMIALATVFSLLRFPPFRIDLWAQGGSIDLVMVPIIVLGWRRGMRWAIPAGLALGLIECLIQGKEIRSCRGHGGCFARQIRYTLYFRRYDLQNRGRRYYGNIRIELYQRYVLYIFLGLQRKLYARKYDSCARFDLDINRAVAQIAEITQQIAESERL